MGFAVLVVVLVAVLVAGLARKFGLAAPLVVLAVGLAVSFIPSLDRIEVEAELILGIVLPPLLYSAALSSSLQDFRAALSPILRLGVVLVVVTTVAVALITRLIEPQYSLAAALLLGAIVAPPDAVAAMAVGRKLGLPRRIMTLLGGESLINDATSLTLFKVALAGAGAAGGLLKVGLQTFALAVVGGIGVGLVLAWGIQYLRSKLRDPASDTVLGLVLPFVAYWLAEEIHGSGVLAVVAAGFFIGQSSTRTAVSTRLHEEPIWASLDLLLESFVFALIGLQLRWVIDEVRISETENTGRALALALAVFVTTVVIRPLFIYFTEFLASFNAPWRSGPRRTRLPWRDLLVTSWAGMRGVVTLAAAIAIPVRDADGALIPGRATLQLAAYAVAIGTLLLQGLTLPAVIRGLNVTSEDEAAQDSTQEAKTRLKAAKAAAIASAEQEAIWAKTYGAEWASRMAKQTTRTILSREAAAAVLLRPDSLTQAEFDAELGGALSQMGSELAEVIGLAGEEQAAGAADEAEADRIEAEAGGQRANPAVADAAERDGRRRRAKTNEVLERGANLAMLVDELRTKMVRAQREVVIAESRAGNLNEVVMRRILRELDLEEESLEATWTNRL